MLPLFEDNDVACSSHGLQILQNIWDQHCCRAHNTIYTSKRATRGSHCVVCVFQFQDSSEIHIMLLFKRYPYVKPSAGVTILRNRPHTPHTANTHIVAHTPFHCCIAENNWLILSCIFNGLTKTPSVVQPKTNVEKHCMLDCWLLALIGYQ